VLVRIFRMTCVYLSVFICIFWRVNYACGNVPIIFSSPSFITYYASIAKSYMISANWWRSTFYWLQICPSRVSVYVMWPSLISWIQSCFFVHFAGSVGHSLYLKSLSDVCTNFEVLPLFHNRMYCFIEIFDFIHRLTGTVK
jgi:hypothetical protein